MMLKKTGLERKIAINIFTFQEGNKETSKSNIWALISQG